MSHVAPYTTKGVSMVTINVSVLCVGTVVKELITTAVVSVAANKNAGAIARVRAAIKKSILLNRFMVNLLKVCE